MKEQGKKNITRRRFVAGTTALAAGFLGGCISGSSEDANTGGNGSRTKGKSSQSEKQNSTQISEDSQDTSSSYSVTMEPVGEIKFSSVPQKWLAYNGGYADMGVALGIGDGLQAVGLPSRFHTQYYDELPGVSIDKGSLTKLVDNGIDREVFYELNCDVHITDPKWLVNNSYFGLEESDIEEIKNRIGPFVGNTIFRRTDKWHDYRYYTMYEAFEKISRVFQRQKRFKKLKELHDDFIANIQSSLPPADSRPNALLVYAASDEPEKFSPYRVRDKGTNKKQWHDLGVSDALSGTGISGLSTTERGKIDYETLLEVDPDVILLRGHETKTRKKFEDTIVDFMRNHKIASELTAVKNNRVFRGGPIYQGPIINLFQTERGAKNLYPDRFSGELFDREKVAAIIKGEF